MNKDRPERPKPEECECCAFPTPELDLYDSHCVVPRPGEETKWLCKLCAGSELGSASEYPEQHDREALMAMRQINYVGNTILKHIREASLWTHIDVQERIRKASLQSNGEKEE